MNDDDILLRIYVPGDEVLAFAQLLKRLTYSDCQRLVDRNSLYGKRAEGDVMWSAVQTVQHQLAWAGYAPR